jgi:hypothetical protein
MKTIGESTAQPVLMQFLWQMVATGLSNDLEDRRGQHLPRRPVRERSRDPRPYQTTAVEAP